MAERRWFVESVSGEIQPPSVNTLGCFSPVLEFLA